MTYSEAFAMDRETISILISAFGSIVLFGSPQKRACFRVGAESGKQVLRLIKTADAQKTENDDFYYALGRSFADSHGGIHDRLKKAE
jgi:hypothetical protein